MIDVQALFPTTHGHVHCFRDGVVQSGPGSPTTLNRLPRTLPREANCPLSLPSILRFKGKHHSELCNVFLVRSQASRDLKR